MPHISVKMLKGRTEDQKKKLSEALKTTLAEVLGCGEKYISVAVEDYTAKEWQDVFKAEITDKSDKVIIEPGYDPASLI